jgi:hypothetical protein
VSKNSGTTIIKSLILKIRRENRIEGMKNAKKILIRKTEGKRPSGDVEVDGKIILKLILKI